MMTGKRLFLLACLIGIFGRDGAHGQTRIDLGMLRQDQHLIVQSVETKPGSSTGPNLGLFVNCSSPTSTTDNKGTVWDALLFVDCADQKLKIRHKAGTVVVLEVASTLLSFADGETPTGARDGINPNFTLKNPPTPAGSLLLHSGGVLMTQGVDYDLAGNTITFRSGAIPKSSSVLTASYRY